MSDDKKPCFEENCICGCHPTLEACGDCCIKIKVNELWKMTGMGLFELKNLIAQATYEIEKTCAHIKNNSYQERLEKLEYFFSGKTKNPIYDVIEMHIEKFNERIEKLENSPFGKSPTYAPLFEKLDKLENELTTKKYMEQNLREACARIEKLEDNISKLNNIINMDDRITFSNVLSRVNELEIHRNLQGKENREVFVRIEELYNNIDTLNNMATERAHLINYKSYLALADRITELENGYISRIGHLGDALHALSEENHKLRNIIKNKCPICHGKDLCTPHCVELKIDI